jgi:uncharacterized protein involved in exopolysaccharide biosynthesis
MRLIAKKAIYDQAVNDGPANLPRVLDSDLISNLKDKYAELSFKHEDLKTTFQDDYPKVRKLKASMDSMRAWIASRHELMQKRKKSFCR